MNKLPERANFLIAKIKEERKKRKGWEAELKEIKNKIKLIDAKLLKRGVNLWQQKKIWEDWQCYCAANDMDLFISIKRKEGINAESKTQ